MSAEPIWTADAAALAAARPYPGEYVVAVLFTRNLPDDMDASGQPDGAAPDAAKLAALLAREMQQGFEAAAISGRFQVVAVMESAQ